MILNTLSKEVLYQSVAEVFSISVREVETFIKKNASEIITYCYDEYSIWKLETDSLLSLQNKFNILNEVMVHHITPRQSVTEIKKEGLLTLPHTLTKKTRLSEYLHGLGYVFEFNDNQIHMKKDGADVEISKLDHSNLRMRFGGKHSLNDFNVNGYLFAVCFRCADCLGWLGSPEILKSLSNAYRDHSIADNYSDKCENYVVSFSVPIEKIDITGLSADITNEEKTEYLIKCSINALAYMEKNMHNIEKMYNPIIMLKRDLDVSGDNVEKIRRFRYTNTLMFPEDM